MRSKRNRALGWSPQILVSLFNFLASLKLAVSSLVVLMVALAAGTLLESAYGAQAAKLLVYQTPWFSALLILLGINLAAAAADRLPWRKKHTGFLLTHLGIIMILLGSLVTQKGMIDGQMSLAEGESGKTISLFEPMLYLMAEKNGGQKAFQVPAKPFRWEGRKEVVRADPASGFPQVTLRAFYPHAVSEEKMMPSGEGAAAVRVQVESSMAKQEFWLLADAPGRSAYPLGPAAVTLKSRKIQRPKEGESPNGYLDLIFEKATYHVQLPEALKPPVTLSVPGKGIEVEILESFRNAFVNAHQLAETPVPEGMTDIPAKNPALRLVVRAGGVEEKHLVFAKFPDFSSIHGAAPDQRKSRVYYHVPEAGAEAGSEFRVVPTEDGLLYQIKQGPELKEGRIAIGTPIESGWMDFRFTIAEYLPKAVPVLEFRPVESKSSSEEALSAIQIEVGQGKDAKVLWLSQGLQQRVEVAGVGYAALYGLRQIPAGFRLTLEDFRLEHYPGTNNPMSFESDVVLTDPMRGVLQKATISMNNPLSYRGYKIYQSGYNLSGPGPEVSIFSVSRDPGIFLKYLGTIVMVAGILLIYYFRGYSQSDGKI